MESAISTPDLQIPMAHTNSEPALYQPNSHPQSSFKGTPERPLKGPVTSTPDLQADPPTVFASGMDPKSMISKLHKREGPFLVSGILWKTWVHVCMMYVCTIQI